MFFSPVKLIVSFQTLNIPPEDYMQLIFNLTRYDLNSSFQGWIFWKVATGTLIRSEQILTEHGLCHITNSFLTTNLSAQ